MRKKILALSVITLFCLGFVGLNFNNKSIKSIISKNIEAMAVEPTWDGMVCSPWWDSYHPGTCGEVAMVLETGKLLSYCHISQSSIGSHGGVTVAWCCDSCPNTTYCNPAVAY